MGRVVKWDRRTRVNYAHCRTGKGELQAWRAVLDDIDDPTCQKCGKHVETGKHIALVCTHGEEIGRRWSSWEDMDEKKEWMKRLFLLFIGSGGWISLYPVVP